MEARYQKNRKAASVAVPEKTIKLSTRGGRRTEMDGWVGLLGHVKAFALSLQWLWESLSGVT